MAYIESFLLYIGVVLFIFILFYMFYAYFKLSYKHGNITSEIYKNHFYALLDLIKRKEFIEYSTVNSAFKYLSWKERLIADVSLERDIYSQNEWEKEKIIKGFKISDKVE